MPRLAPAGPNPQRAYMRQLAKDAHTSPSNLPRFSRHGWKRLRAISACASRAQAVAWLIADRTKARLIEMRPQLPLMALTTPGLTVTRAKPHAPLSHALPDGFRARMDRREERVARNAAKRAEQRAGKINLSKAGA